MTQPDGVPATCSAPLLDWLGGIHDAVARLCILGLVGTDGFCLRSGWARGESSVMFDTTRAHMRLTRTGVVTATLAFDSADLLLSGRSGALYFYAPLPETVKDGIFHRYVHEVFDHPLLQGSTIRIEGVQRCRGATALRLTVPVVDLTHLSALG